MAERSSFRAPSPGPAVRNEWRRRAEAEYCSAAVTHHLTQWLLLLAAPPSLVRSGLRIVGDELAHSELSYRVYRSAGGDEPPRLLREALVLPRAPEAPLEHDTGRAVVDLFCIGETVAVPLFHRLRRGCKVPIARAALDRILKDEVRHRDFGWRALSWLLELPAAGEIRAILNRELAGYVTRIRRAYVREHGAPPFDERDRAWGLMPAADYAEAVRRTEDEVWVPRFRELGIAWC
jgi:hypothetical protein